MVRQALALAAALPTLHGRRLRLWGLALGLALIALAVPVLTTAWHWTPGWHQMPYAIALAVMLSALVCEYLDSSMGMGFGTTLTPVLLVAGFEPMQVVPAVLLSELVTGLTAAAMHHRDGNVDLIGDPRVVRTALLLSALSTIGAVAAVWVAVSISKFWLTLSITAIILTMGVLILATARRQLPFRAGHLIAVGAVAAFNKGLSGGGYGPLVTAGQVISGLPAKHAVAITSLAESFTCLVGLIAYFALGKTLDLALAVPLVLGALLSVPMATLTVRHLPEHRMRGAVGITTLLLGLISLAKLIG